MNKLSIHMYLLSAAVAATGCTVQGEPGAQQAQQPTEHPGTGMGDHEPLDPLDPLLGPGRDAQRLSIDQVAASFVTVLGQPWTVNTPEGYRYPIEYLFSALGQPDYYFRLAEDLDPHLLFAKFLNEGAYAACGDAVDADQSVTRSDRRVMRKIEVADTSREAVLENLRDMRLRFHGVRVEPTDVESLMIWQQLFNEVSALPGHTPADGWRAVCVAMVTDPEFALN